MRERSAEPRARDYARDPSPRATAIRRAIFAQPKWESKLGMHVPEREQELQQLSIVPHCPEP